MVKGENNGNENNEFAEKSNVDDTVSIHTHEKCISTQSKQIMGSANSKFRKYK